MAPPLPGRNENDSGGKPASSSVSAKIAATVGVSLEGLITTVLPCHQRRHGHAAEDREREIPGRDHDAHAECEISELAVFARHLHDGLRAAEPLHFARVVFAKINRFRGFGFSFGPGLAGFENQPRIEIEFAFAKQRGRADEHVNP